MSAVLDLLFECIVKPLLWLLYGFVRLVIVIFRRGRGDGVERPCFVIPPVEAEDAG
ncbi:MAG: hypothetical protein V3T70_06335 [Phycisphaerae bacterium]